MSFPILSLLSPLPSCFFSNGGQNCYGKSTGSLSRCIKCGKGKVTSLFFLTAFFFTRYSDENRADPTDVVIVDLQNTKLGRLGIELAYFFCSTTSPEQRKDHLEELLQLYYDEFLQQLTQLGGGCEKTCYTLEKLKDDFNECYPFGFIMGCMHSQVNLVELIWLTLAIRWN